MHTFPIHPITVLCINNYTYRSISQSLLYIGQVGSGHPAFSDQTLLGHVHVEQVQCVVDSLHLADHDGPAGELLGHAGQDTLSVIAGLVQHLLSENRFVWVCIVFGFWRDRQPQNKNQ